MRRLAEYLKSFQNTAGPAGTLLIVTVLLVLATSLARATPEPTPPAPLPALTSVIAETPVRVAPGAVFDIAVRLDAPRDLRVYLPGLDQARVPLAYDPVQGRHVGALTLPWFAPPQGYCTLRIIDGHGLEFDVQLELERPSHG